MARAASGAYFPPDGYFHVRQFPTPSTRVDVLFRTRRTPLQGFDQVVPRGLYARIRGQAESIYEALDYFTTAAQNVLPLIAVSANAPIKNLQSELAWESASGLEEREFFQQFLREDRLLPYRRRKVNARATKDLLSAVSESGAQRRLLRACAQYFHALQEWGPGQEVMALVHIYIGAEVLTPVARNAYLRQYGVSRTDLADAWKIKLKQLDSEVRLRLLFDGDKDTYSKVKDASGGFEHGFMDFHDIRATALELREKAAGYLRRALLRLSGLSGNTISELLSHPYSKPFGLEYTKHLWGTLHGKTDELAAPEQEFPTVTWRSKPTPKPYTSGPDPEIIFEENISPQIASGLTFRAQRLELWGANPDKKDSTLPSPIA